MYDPADYKAHKLVLKSRLPTLDVPPLTGELRMDIEFVCEPIKKSKFTTPKGDLDIRPFLYLGLVIFGVVSCSQSDWFKANQAQQAADRAARQTPHVIREVDGCKVYAFEADGRMRYFTRCPGDRTTTESSWTESCGKACTRTRIETIDN